MPGSKRRALKKLLSPVLSPTHSHHPKTSSPPTTDSSTSLSSPSLSSLPPPPAAVEGVAANPENYRSDKEVADYLHTQHELQIMEERRATIGTSHGADALAESAGTNGASKKKSSRQRFAEREARKKEALLASAPPSDPDWTAQLEKERMEEIQVISDACLVLGREIFEIAPDGHCMYSSIADQLGQLGLIPLAESTSPVIARKTAAKYMLDHPDDFMAFLPSIGGEDSAGALDDGVITESDFKVYCGRVAETGEWGGEPEIQALSRAFDVPIHVIQRGPPTVVAHGGGAMTPEESKALGDKVVRITYHRRMYGLGEHYNSLRIAQ